MAIDFSLSEILDSIDSSTMILGALFILIFAFTNYILSKTLIGRDGKSNSAISGVMSLSISLLAVYGINKIGLDYESLLSSIGISSDFLYVALPVILLIGAIYLLVRLRSLGLLIIGVVFIGAGLTDLVYEKTTVLIMGIVILIIWAIVSYWSYRIRHSLYLRRGRGLFR
ncbi:MAG: hypothetical protein AABW81_02735 [Nanoarchaeota archaeon]